MLELEKWGENKPKNLVMVAHDFATGAEAAFHFLTSVKDRRRPEGYFELPHVSKWLEFYSSNFTIIDYFVSKIREDEEGSGSENHEFEELVDQLMLLRKGDKCFLAKWEKQKKLLGPEKFRIKEKIKKRNLREAYEFHLEELREDIRGDRNKFEIQKQLDEIFQDDYMKFFIRVYSPCWFIHGKRPDELMAQAREGHLDSLKKLLQIDKAIIGDVSISQLFHQLSTQKNKRKFDALVSALAGSPNKKTSIGRIKTNCAGFISVISEFYGHRLYEPDLRALFNAVAVDYDRHEQIDEDIPADPATFSRAILRERKFWINNLFTLPDKTI